MKSRVHLRAGSRLGCDGSSAHASRCGNAHSDALVPKVPRGQPEKRASPARVLSTLAFARVGAARPLPVVDSNRLEAERLHWGLRRLLCIAPASATPSFDHIRSDRPVPTAQKKEGVNAYMSSAYDRYPPVLCRHPGTPFHLSFERETRLRVLGDNMKNFSRSLCMKNSIPNLHPLQGTFVGSAVLLTALFSGCGVSSHGDGDGDSAVNTSMASVAASHTSFLELSDLTVEVTDAVVGEYGTVNVDHDFKTVRLDRRYTNPVVVAFVSTNNGSDFVETRMRNVQEDRFDIRLQEPNYLDGSHAVETVSYMVVERGRHVLANGAVIEAGTVDTDALFYSRKKERL